MKREIPDRFCDFGRSLKPPKRPQWPFNCWKASSGKHRTVQGQHREISANYHSKYRGAGSQNRLCTTVKFPENKFWRTNINIVQKKDTEGENSSAPEPRHKRLVGEYADAGFVELTQNEKYILFHYTTLFISQLFATFSFSPTYLIQFLFTSFFFFFKSAHFT